MISQCFNYSNSIGLVKSIKIYRPDHQLIQSVKIHSLIHSIIHSIIHSYSFFHSFIHYFIHSNISLDVRVH